MLKKLIPFSEFFVHCRKLKLQHLEGNVIFGSKFIDMLKRAT